MCPTKRSRYLASYTICYGHLPYVRCKHSKLLNTNNGCQSQGCEPNQAVLCVSIIEGGRNILYDICQNKNYGWVGGRVGGGGGKVPKCTSPERNEGYSRERERERVQASLMGGRRRRHCCSTLSSSFSHFHATNGIR